MKANDLQSFNCPVNAQQEMMIRRAAAAAGGTVEDFLARSVLESAERVLADRARFFADDEQWEQFQQLLRDVPQSAPKLERLSIRDSPFGD